MANETWKFVQAKSKQAMKQVLGIKDEAARMKVTPPLAVAPLAHGDDMRWNRHSSAIEGLHVLTLTVMPSSFGFHRMSSPCARGATASGGVTLKRAASSLIPSTCFIACLLFF